MTSKPPHPREENPVDGASVTLGGSVQRTMPRLAADGVETAEISIDGAEHLYREIRIPNLLKDRNGKNVALQPGSEVEITITLRSRKA